MLGYLNLRHDLVGDSRLVGKDESPLVLLVEGFLRLLIESYPKQRLGKSLKMSMMLLTALELIKISINIA